VKQQNQALFREIDYLKQSGAFEFVVICMEAFEKEDAHQRQPGAAWIK